MQTAFSHCLDTISILIYFYKSNGLRQKLLNDAYNSTRTYSSSALTDSETKTLLHSYWMNQLYGHLYVIARHTHLNTLWQIANAVTSVVLK